VAYGVPSMNAPTIPLKRRADRAFRHEALLYAGDAEFLAGTVPFLREGLVAEEPMLVVVSAAKIDALRDALNGDAEQIHFADMGEIGTNPARIIPAWRQFVSDQLTENRQVRGIGEPIWAARTPAELVECQRHEALLNLAFAVVPAWRLLCPYDTDALAPAVIDEAHRSHPFIVEGGAIRSSQSYGGLERLAAPFDHPLPEPLVQPAELAFRSGSLVAVRRFVAVQAAPRPCPRRRPIPCVGRERAGHQQPCATAAGGACFGSGKTSTP
jgi:MEDS: MEthanogen/methylotroph, DcmR Sensory domain